jgi:ABC-type transport system involved in multi-copper enzyme maturation permease subunit
MNKILSIAYYTVIENIRNKVFYVLVLFGMILLTASFLFSAMGGEQPVRILLDLGFSSIEFFALVTMCFASVNLVLEEMESKTIYLILTRPISRFTYLAGRYIGLVAAIYIGMAVMSAMHLGILFAKGWIFTPRYFIALMFSMEKIAIIGSLALFFSLFSSSAISSISFTFAFWVLGHFSEEMRFLGRKADLVMTKVLASVMYYITPNLQLFNIKDFWDIPQIVSAWIYPALLYGVFYSFLCVLFSLLLLRYKEF